MSKRTILKFEYAIEPFIIREILEKINKKVLKLNLFKKRFIVYEN